MSSRPSIQFYPGDRLRELMPILSDSEAIGAWTKAWMYLWGAGPSAPEVVAQVAGKGWDRVGFLFDHKDGLISLSWMEEKRAESAAFLRRQAMNGKKGGRPKSATSARNNPGLSSGKPKKNPNKSPRVEGEVEGEVLGSEKKERAQEEFHQATLWPSFDDFWDLYERKGSRKLTEVEWKRLGQADREAVMSRTPGYLRSRPEKQYRKDGERYLKHRAWEDEQQQPATTNKHQTDEQYRDSVLEAARHQFGR